MSDTRRYSACWVSAYTRNLVVGKRLVIDRVLPEQVPLGPAVRGNPEVLRKSMMSIRHKLRQEQNSGGDYVCTFFPSTV